MSKTNVNLASQWREEADLENPAGPLYAGGEFAAADIVSASEPTTLGGHPCSLCTGSTPVSCC
ncbi:MAG: DUF6229 family protein [Rhizomicrobium sp.]